MATEIGFGRIRYIREIVGGWVAGESVRVFGRIKHPSDDSLPKLEHEGQTLRVSSDALGDDIVLKEGLMYCVIGELYPDSEGECVLVSRVARMVEGMDMELFRKALELKREFDIKWDAGQAGGVGGDAVMQD